MMLYVREKRYGEAAEQARQLSAKYPRNYLYRLETADALVSQATMASNMKQAPKDVHPVASDAYAIYQSISDKDIAGTSARLKDLIHFKYGEALLKTGRNQRAVRNSSPLRKQREPTSERQRWPTCTQRSRLMLTTNAERQWPSIVWFSQGRMCTTRTFKHAGLWAQRAKIEGFNWPDRQSKKRESAPR